MSIQSKNVHLWEKRQVALQSKKTDELAKELLWEIFTLNQGLVGRYCRVFGSSEDYLAEGNIALLEAIKTWEPAKGTLGTHAWVRIKKAVLTEVAKSEYNMDVNTFSARSVLHSTESMLTSKYGRKPTIEELASSSGLSAYTVKKIYAAERTMYPQSMSVTKEDIDSGSSGVRGVTKEPSSPSAEDQVIAAEDFSEGCDNDTLSNFSPSQMRVALAECSMIELAVGLRRTGADGGPPADTLKLASLLGVSRETLRRSFEGFKSKLSKHLADAP